ncbi:MAG: SpoIID/LytB domain-containing protein [Eubacterium sp.]
MFEKVLIFILLICVAVNVVYSYKIFDNTEENSIHVNTRIFYSYVQSDKSAKSLQSIEDSDEIVGILITADNSSIYHDSITFSSDSSIFINDENQQTEEVTIEQSNQNFTAGKIKVYSEDKIGISTIIRNGKTPYYDGFFNLYLTDNGIVIVNNIETEKYLYSVVSSELSDAFELEALKAQAVCARSYILYQMQNPKYVEYNACVDDTTSSQVYNNKAATDKSIQAVQETEGCVLAYNDEIIKSYYYSTSCGSTAPGTIWNNTDYNYLTSTIIGNTSETVYDLKNEMQFREFIDTYKDVYDCEYPYYRWKCNLTLEDVEEAVESYLGYDIGALKKIETGNRLDGGILGGIVIYGTKKTVQISGQYYIRNALVNSVEVELNDGTTRTQTMLPSAFFYIDEIYEDSGLSGYRITGGGYGHGCGMSQNAANSMALKGMTYKEILSCFYEKATIQKIY